MSTGDCPQGRQSGHLFSFGLKREKGGGGVGETLGKKLPIFHTGFFTAPGGGAKVEKRGVVTMVHKFQGSRAAGDSIDFTVYLACPHRGVSTGRTPLECVHREGGWGEDNRPGSSLAGDKYFFRRYTTVGGGVHSALPGSQLASGNIS